MFNKKLMMLTILLVSLLAISTVSAADNATSDIVGVNQINDELENNAMNDVDDNLGITQENALSTTHTVSGNTFADIQNSVNNAKSGDTVTLSGNYSGSGSHIKIDKTLTIEGNGATLDAKSLSKIFEITATNVKVNDIHFINGNSASSGAIDWWNGGYAGERQSNGHLTNCTFTNCHAQYNAGAVYFCDNSLAMYDCKFYNNNAFKGGAVYVSGNDCIIDGCEFYKNSVNYDVGNAIVACGGAIVLEGQNHVIDNCIFEDNTINMELSLNFDYYDDGPEDKYGAAIRILNDKNDSNILISNSIFSNKFHWYKFYTHDPDTLYEFQTSSNIVSNSIYYIAKDTCRFNNEEYGEFGIGTNYIEVNLKKIASSNVTKYFGGSEKYIVTLTENGKSLSNKNVNISLNGKESTVKTDYNGQASVDLDLGVGNYTVTATYIDVSTTSKVTVKSTVTTDDASAIYLNSKVNAIFLNTDGKALASKQITFKAGDKTYVATTNSNGVATADIDLGVGTYTVTAINPVNNEQKQFKLVIDKANSAISLASNQINGVTTLTATLTPVSATGNVVFNVNGEDKSAAIKNGKATLTLSDLNPGDYNVTASYSGDKNLNASTSNTVTFNVAEVYPILAADPVTKTYGTSTKLVVNLADNKGNAIANADVSVVMGSATKHIKTDADGQATMSINKAPGSYTAAIAYADAQTTAKITVKKATPKLTAKAKTFKKSVKTKKYTVTLKTNQNKVMKNTKVTIKVNKKTYSAKTNSKGQATFKITKLTKKGKFTATIKYAGSKYYNAKTVKAKITVK